jgi:hypothetical protein
MRCSVPVPELRTDLAPVDKECNRPAAREAARLSLTIIVSILPLLRAELLQLPSHISVDTVIVSPGQSIFFHFSFFIFSSVYIIYDIS